MGPACSFGGDDAEGDNGEAWLLHASGTQKSTYFCKKDKKVSDTGREGGGEDRVSR